MGWSSKYTPRKPNAGSWQSHQRRWETRTSSSIFARGNRIDVQVDDVWVKLSNEKRAPGCLGLGGEILPSDVGIMVSHSRDPYQTTSIMENKRVFSGFKLVLPSNQQEWPECQMFQMNLVVHEGRTFKSSFVRHEVHMIYRFWGLPEPCFSNWKFIITILLLGP